VSTDFSHAVLAFGANLRDEHGFTLAHAKGHDALRAAEIVGIVDRERLRHAFRFIYCTTPGEAQRFDDAFDRFFSGPEGIAQPDAPARRTRPGPDTPSERRTSPESSDPDPETDESDGGAQQRTRPADGFPEAAAAWQQLRARYSPGAAVADPPLISSDGLDALLAAAGTLIAGVRLGRSRRWRPKRNGPRFDLRRTLRASVAAGGEPATIHRLGPPRRNPRFVVLIDGSRSMAEHTGPSLQFAYALCRRTRRARAFVFSTAMREVTRAMRNRQQEGHLLHGLGEAWGGGTRLGANLTAFVRGAGEQLLRRDTVVLIASDGLDTGDTAALKRAMRVLRGRCAAVVWLHPHAAEAGFAPSASGMRAALPYVTVFAAAGNRSDFIRLARSLGREI